MRGKENLQNGERAVSDTAESREPKEGAREEKKEEGKKYIRPEVIDVMIGCISAEIA